MTIRATLLAGAALLMCAGAAGAAPATTQSAINLRAGPGTHYPVVATIPGGAPVDVSGCTGSWCAVNYPGGSGYAKRNRLAMAGGPSVGVAVAPYPYGYPDYAYGDDYYDYGYAYGPSFGFYANGRFHRRHDRGWSGHWNGQTGWNRGGNIGQQPQTNVPGTANYNRGASFNRGTGFAGRPQMSAPAGMRGPAPGSVAPMGGGGGGAPLAGTASGAAAGLGGGAGAAAGGATGAMPGTAGVRH